MMWHSGSTSGLLFSISSACYNKCIKKLFGFQRRDSMSGILNDLCLPTADTIVHNARFLFDQMCMMSCNNIVMWFRPIAIGI